MIYSKKNKRIILIENLINLISFNIVILHLIKSKIVLFFQFTKLLLQLRIRGQSDPLPTTLSEIEQPEARGQSGPLPTTLPEIEEPQPSGSGL